MKARIWNPEAIPATKQVTGYNYLLQCGDAVGIMKLAPENSIDAICTDGPYGLEFMGKNWDSFGAGVEKDAKSAGGFGKDAPTNENAYGAARVRHGEMSLKAAYAFQDWSENWAREAIRILKPGGYILSFGGTRTHHRMVCGLEDAGFEIRDQIDWVYGSGFPKSHDFTKAAGEKFATKWRGWGTAIKPAHECICLARKPLSERTVADNVMRWGVGALNIDGCRIKSEDASKFAKNWDRKTTNDIRGGNLVNGKAGNVNLSTKAPEGRWPANVIFGHTYRCTEEGCWWDCPLLDHVANMAYFYCCKPSKREKDLGLTSLDEKKRVFWQTGNGKSGKSSSISEGRNTAGKNIHPTVKPVELMRFLIRLITPPQGILVDPFMGSGTTGVAAIEEGFYFIGYEGNPEYFDIGALRCENAAKFALANRQLPAR